MGGWWLKDEARCTKPPLPFDAALQCSKLAASAHETVPGVMVSASLLPMLLMLRAYLA